MLLSIRLHNFDIIQNNKSLSSFPKNHTCILTGLLIKIVQMIIKMKNKAFIKNDIMTLDNHF